MQVANHRVGPDTEIHEVAAIADPPPGLPARTYRQHDAQVSDGDIQRRETDLVTIFKTREDGVVDHQSVRRVEVVGQTIRTKRKVAADDAVRRKSRERYLHNLPLVSG